MKNKKMILFLSLLCMIVGFASVSTTLYLNGVIGIGANQPDFDVYFSKAVEDGIENNTLIQDKTHIEFTTELSKINEKYVLKYDVTNASKQYDASIIINCTGGNEYLRVSNRFDTTEILPARTTRSGKLTLTVIKTVMDEMSISISCEITGKAVERDTVGGETIENEKENYLAVVKESRTPEISAPYLGYEIDRSKVESINIMDTKEAPVGSTLIGDVSENQNGSILIYSKDEDSNDMLELYIGQNGGVKANPNSNSLFGIFPNLVSINGLEYLDTSNVTIMSSMFENCNKLTSLDLSSFDTSQVTNMQSMFTDCSSLTKLDVSSFDTNKVTDMSSMFRRCNSLTDLDLNNFDTSQVTNMYSLFDRCSGLTMLNVNSFDTSQVTDMSYMFSGCSSLTSLDISSFNTSKVQGMISMFDNCKKLTNLDLSHFDTSNVTNMYYMFQICASLTTTITIRGNKCLEYHYMFAGAATEDGAQITINYTEDASDLVDQMIDTKSSDSNVVKGSQLPHYTITIDEENITSDLTEAYEKKLVTLSAKETNKAIMSFKVNGTLVKGSTFIMPAENVTITEVVTVTATIIESEHNPYPNNINNKVIGEETFDGATSLTVILDYETESTYYDWIYLYDSTGKQYGKYGGYTRTTETITIPGNYIKIIFNTDSNRYINCYGFKAAIIPNYE